MLNIRRRQFTRCDGHRSDAIFELWTRRGCSLTSPPSPTRDGRWRRSWFTRERLRGESISIARLTDTHAATTVHSHIAGGTRLDGNSVLRAGSDHVGRYSISWSQTPTFARDQGSTRDDDWTLLGHTTVAETRVWMTGPSADADADADTIDLHTWTTGTVHTPIRHWAQRGEGCGTHRDCSAPLVEVRPKATGVVNALNGHVEFQFASPKS